MIKSFKMFESGIKIPGNNYEDPEGYYEEILGGAGESVDWDLVLHKYEDILVPISNTSINRITSFIEKNKRLPETKINITSYTTKATSRNKNEKEVKYITIGDGFNFCSWGRWPSDDWKTEDQGKINNIQIRECDDEWFLVKITGYSKYMGSNSRVCLPNIYKCDQLDGLFKLLKNYGLTYVNKEV